MFGIRTSRYTLVHDMNGSVFLIIKYLQRKADDPSLVMDIKEAVLTIGGGLSWLLGAVVVVLPGEAVTVRGRLD